MNAGYKNASKVNRENQIADLESELSRLRAENEQLKMKARIVSNVLDEVYGVNTGSIQDMRQDLLNYRVVCRIENKRLATARAAIQKLKRGDCWCKMAIGNPMVKTHSEGCRLAKLTDTDKEAK